MTTLTYDLNDFVSEMENLVQNQLDPQRIFDTGSTYLRKLLGNPEAIPSQFRLPVGRGRRPSHGSYVLYQGDSGLQVTAVVWGPGEHTGPHDHLTWGMIGVLDNALTETRFRRVDDRMRAGYAQLVQDRRSTFKPGEITLLVPETDEIHQMDNFTDRPTVEIHVYGKDLRGLNRHRYDLESGRIIPFATAKYDNC
jgi:predicted metal-dependent enzyme (double-stranded beta helix superfamily)